MKITSIKRFSEAYNNLREYFNKIEACTYRQESLFPQVTGPYTMCIKKEFNASDWDIPCSSSTFKSLYDSFIDELSYAVLDYSQNTVIAMLKVYFGSAQPVFKYGVDDVFKYGREDLVELIELYNEATNQINDLIYGTATEEGFGMTFLGSYDSFKKCAREKRGKQISEVQVEEELYASEYIDRCAHNMFDDWETEIIAQGTTNDILDDDIPNDIQNNIPVQSENLLSIFKNDQKILDAFLLRIKGKSGVKVVIEVQALMKLNKIRKEDINRPLWTEISKIQNIGTESNWNTVLNSKHTLQVEAIVNEYQRL